MEKTATTNTPKISFSYNWNLKLFCNAFTTVRLHNPTKYKKGIEYSLFLKDRFIGYANIIEIRTLHLEKINEFVAQMDSGYNLLEFKRILRKMYPNVDFDVTLLDIILLKKTKEYQGMKNGFKTNDSIFGIPETPTVIQRTEQNA